VGTNGFILLLLIGFLFERIDMFVDIAIAYALLNFIIMIVLAKYFSRIRGKSQ
jgi:multicomponent Na+:H+ antiporter subunit F